jgi:hypothetical protein
MNHVDARCRGRDRQRSIAAERALVVAAHVDAVTLDPDPRTAGRDRPAREPTGAGGEDLTCR